MKVPNNNQTRFLKKIIDKTKARDIDWFTMSYEDSMLAFPYELLDREGGFRCDFSSNGTLLLAMRGDGLVLGSVGTDFNHMEPLDINDESISVLLLRLFNLISEFKPNARKLIDDFLALD